MSPTAGLVCVATNKPISLSVSQLAIPEDRGGVEEARGGEHEGNER
jgi:hypothetical protein